VPPKSKPKIALSAAAHDELKRLPGNVLRQMVLAIDSLAQDLRPENSKQLIIENDEREVRRLRVAGWRIIYLVLEEEPLILAIRRRHHMIMTT
jgi:mRNA-degrading endonuclease RelE of RelBE toxin-antitoxin system